MTRTSKYNRVVVSLTLILIIGHAYLGHYEHGKIIDALAEHQQHSIEAFATINSLIAQGILKRAVAQNTKDTLRIEEAKKPTPTPEPPHIHYRTRTKRINEFRWPWEKP